MNNSVLVNNFTCIEIEANKMNGMQWEVHFTKLHSIIKVFFPI